MNTTENESRTLLNWQKSLLPFTLRIIALLAAFFFIASIVQLFYLHQRIEKSPELNLDPVLGMINQTSANLTSDEKLNYIRWETLAILEKQALERRYHQANVLLMARTWTSYLGFVTGMIIALVGAIFILGKLRESDSKLDAAVSAWKLSITSGSPGLVLAILGTTLMVITIVTHYEIEVNDAPLFTSVWTQAPGSLRQLPPPEDLQADSIGQKLKNVYSKH